MTGVSVSWVGWTGSGVGGRSFSFFLECIGLLLYSIGSIFYDFFLTYGGWPFGRLAPFAIALSEYSAKIDYNYFLKESAINMNRKKTQKMKGNA